VFNPTAEPAAILPRVRPKVMDPLRGWASLGGHASALVPLGALGPTRLLHGHPPARIID